MLLVFFVFFFKQKTAYEMRISDWSSDVCSSDLHQFGDLDRVQRRTLADVVRDYPQVEPALVRQVLADAADEDRVVARGGRDRRRIAAVGGLGGPPPAPPGLEERARPARGGLVAGVGFSPPQGAGRRPPPHHRRR